MAADLFDYRGRGLLGGFISEVYFHTVKDLIESFYREPSILDRDGSWVDYYVKIRGWLEKTQGLCEIKRPFVSVSPEAVFLANNGRVAIFRDYSMMALMRNRYDFPFDTEDISYTDEESLEKYLKTLKSNL